MRKILERLYPYLERVNHIHLSKTDVLYASEVWDVLYAPDPVPCPECGLLVEDCSCGKAAHGTA